MPGEHPNQAAMRSVVARLLDGWELTCGLTEWHRGRHGPDGTPHLDLREVTPAERQVIEAIPADHRKELTRCLCRFEPGTHRRLEGGDPACPVHVLDDGDAIQADQGSGT